jgi:hypothetical protein
MTKPGLRQAGATSAALAVANPVTINAATASTREVFIGSIPVFIQSCRLQRNSSGLVYEESLQKPEEVLSGAG